MSFHSQRVFNPPPPAPPSIASVKTLRDVEPLVASKYGTASKAPQAVQDVLHEGLYSLEEIEGLLGLKLEALFGESAVNLKVLEAGREDGGFKLRDRALHVYEVGSGESQG